MLVANVNNISSGMSGGSEWLSLSVARLVGLICALLVWGFPGWVSGEALSENGVTSGLDGRAAGGVVEAGVGEDIASSGVGAVRGQSALQFSSPWLGVKKGDWGIYRLLGGTRMAAVLLVVREIRSEDVMVEVSMIEADQNVTRQVIVPRSVSVEQLPGVVLSLLDLKRKGLQPDGLTIRAVPVRFGGSAREGLTLISMWRGQVGNVEAIQGSRKVSFTLAATAPLLGIIHMGVVDTMDMAGTVLHERMSVELVDYGSEEGIPVS